MNIRKQSSIAITAGLLAVVLSLQVQSAVRADETLYGGVTKNEQVPIVSTEDDTNLQPETATADAYRLAVQKLSSGAQMTAEDYRDLGIGVNGIDAEKFPDQKYARIIRIYPGSPADLAGIRVGEKLVWKHEKDFRPGDHVSFTFKNAGESMDVTVIRHGKPVTFTLICQNMEDIRVARIRHQWEDVAQRLGYPHEGAYSGTNDFDLMKVDN
jgi:C-terminal processing protease CtpA/Prc